jgi:hypothetical protein
VKLDQAFFIHYGKHENCEPVEESESREWRMCVKWSLHRSSAFEGAVCVDGENGVSDVVMESLAHIIHCARCCWRLKMVASCDENLFIILKMKNITTVGCEK